MPPPPSPAPAAGGEGDGGGSIGGSSHAGGNNNAPVFKEALTWQAYGRTPVLSMVVTSYGEHAIFDIHCNDDALLLFTNSQLPTLHVNYVRFQEF